MYLTNSHSNVAGINDSPFSLPSLPLIGRQLIGNLGAVPDPTLAPRCASLMVTVPATYQELEATVRNWIATCVTSRTQSGGRPIHREIALVTNNPSLINLWNTALKNITGQKVQVIARYKWRMGGVESIDFSMPTITVQEPMEVIARPMPVSWDDFVRRAFDLLKRQKQLGQDMGPYITRRLACLLPKLRDPKFDDRYVDHATIVRRQNWITKADPNWNHIIMHARVFLNRARHPRSSDQFVLLLLPALDASIWGAIQFLDQEYNLRQSTMQPGLVVIKDWIHDQQKRPNNTYGACFSGSI